VIKKLIKKTFAPIDQAAKTLEQLLASVGFAVLQSPAKGLVGV